jgi:hypothetical protein
MMSAMDGETLDRRVAELERQLTAARTERMALEQQLAADGAEHAAIMQGPARDVVGKPRQKKLRDSTIVALIVLAAVSAAMLYLMWLVRR